VLPIESQQAVHEVASRLQEIATKHRPEAVAFYIGAGVV